MFRKEKRKQPAYFGGEALRVAGKRGGRCFREIIFFRHSSPGRHGGQPLLAQAESLDDGAVAVDVVDVEILQELAAASYHHGQRASCEVVLVVLLQVLGEVLDAVGEEGDLALCAAGVCGRLAVLCEDLSLFCFVEIHCLK